MRTAFFTTAISIVFLAAASASAQNALPALTGQVTSQEEGAMEGVVVSAKKNGSTITVSVVSDAKGNFNFPASRLSPGHYTVTARAVGYDPARTFAADIAASKTANTAIRLKKTADLSAQLTNAEWLESAPGTFEQKKFLTGCVSCHTLERIMKSTYDADGFVQVIARMGTYSPQTTPEKPQTLIGDAARPRATGDQAKQIGLWLETINRSKTGKTPFALKTLPRLKGASTRVVITEYDLPQRAIQPHDVILDERGMVWYSSFGEQALGRMDPKTGRVVEFPIPVSKPGFPLGSLDLEIDYEGNLWLGMMYQAAIAKFDRKTERFQLWPIPEKAFKSDSGQIGHIALTGLKTDGIVWAKNSDDTEILRLDVATGRYEDLGPMKDPRTGRKFPTYGVHSNSQNNLYLLDYGLGALGRIDAKTRNFTIFNVPTKQSRPRRGRADSQDRIWFGEYGPEGNGIGVLDPKTAEVREWKVPTPWSVPYDAVYDEKGHAWAGSMMTDRVARLDVKAGRYVEYQMPRSTNIRRVFADKAGALWIGSNHGGSIIKVEPLN